MREWEPESWRREWTATRGPLAVFIHTPLCGTCKLARKMLDVVREVLPEAPLVAANLNAMPELAQLFRIESVPCLLMKSADGHIGKIYGFSNVVDLTAALKPLCNGGGTRTS
ncbi:thioredoxin family protein [Cohnella faecalis]|uniref:thioredoxin family protein n=1 Tax=Cohnella faecalis TaxID=2315694 RepID=UPI003612586F